MREKILLIDDELDIIEFLKLLLGDIGYDIITATNGREGLTKVLKENPDLILLDVMMPQMNGWEVCELIKANPSSKNTPVIMLTAKSDLSNKVKGMQVGATGYITKPFELDKIISQINILLKNKVIA